MQRMKEDHPNGVIVHVEGASSDDRTLCGYAYEGSAMKGKPDSSLRPAERGKINCADCIAIIEHCHRVSRLMFVSRGARRSAIR